MNISVETGVAVVIYKVQLEFHYGFYLEDVVVLHFLSFICPILFEF